MIRVSNTIIKELISRTNIIDIISHKFYLKKQGKNFVGHCPFHDEKNPSFTVSIEKQFYYCFSCGSHGNVIDFLMNHDKLNFIESIQFLSNMHGISINSNINACKNNNSQQNDLYQLVNELCEYYINILNQKKYSYVYEYLKKRGLNSETINNFSIGFAPPEWEHSIKITKILSYKTELLKKLGIFLGKHLNYHQRYNRFHNRIIFPIHNINGNIIAFGGRSISDKTTPKYLNSADTAIFKKSQNLYGLYKNYVQHKKIPYILLVEGYFDVISLMAFKIPYVTATLGTNITAYQINMLYKITDCIICCYDGDNAGKIAAWRTLNQTLPYLTDKREIYFIFLPNGEDPDTLIRKIGKDKFLKILQNKQDISNFLFKILSQKINLQTLSGKIKLSNLILPMIKKIPGETLKLYLLQQLGNKIGILDDRKLHQLLQKTPVSSDYNTKITKNIDISNTVEHILIGLLMQNPKLAKLVPDTQILQTYENYDIKIFIDLVETCKTYTILNSAQLLEHYRDNNFFKKLEILTFWNHMVKEDIIENTFIEALIKLHNLILKQKQETLIAQDRVNKLTQQERRELWLINQALSVQYNTAKF
ncbi:DNA primase [Candidatus Blochmannia ocreatus (nom. nud.)]|uniref:DNA primase n=1 Tax=Candidatus Blochmannia ocreatus (nom. nud.) TaxID=251538 RepID=A0ABY4SU52_9ENTR|nr:DNA primase [Candidatus Blochmannia ocreatus]URJ25406.1 DNA primase [Candidatus Blochmannia ocreatus]